MEKEIENLIRNLSYFKVLPNQLFSKIKQNIILENFNSGERLIDPSLIPNKISFIVSGNIRSIYEDNSGIYTLEKASYGFPIGVVSHLRKKGCENVFTSSEVNLVSIPDQLFFEIFHLRD